MSLLIMCGIVMQGDIFTKINFLKCPLILGFKGMIYTIKSQFYCKVENYIKILESFHKFQGLFWQ